MPRALIFFFSKKKEGITPEQISVRQVKEHRSEGGKRYLPSGDKGIKCRENFQG